VKKHWNEWQRGSVTANVRSLRILSSLIHSSETSVLERPTHSATSQKTALSSEVKEILSVEHAVGRAQKVDKLKLSAVLQLLVRANINFCNE
jgi:hypothetical protein